MKKKGDSMKEKVIESFEKDEGFINKNNFKIIELDEEHAKMEYEIKKSGLNPIGIVHGGLLFGLADTTAGVLASMSGKFPLTMSSTINYLKEARGNRIYAISKKLKEGRNVGYYEARIYNDQDELICLSTINMYFVKKS